MRDIYKYAIALAFVIAIFVFAIVSNQNAMFGGADVAGKEAIAKINPNYKPWFAPLWQPKPETESMLFALQAAIGALVIGYFIGFEHGRKAVREQSAQADSNEKGRHAALKSGQHSEDGGHVSAANKQEKVD
jgi:cobalt/nickel transport protein